MKLAFFCPKCEELVIALYNDDVLKVIEGCHCPQHDLMMTLMNDWDNTVIINLDKYMELKTSQLPLKDGACLGDD